MTLTRISLEIEIAENSVFIREASEVTVHLALFFLLFIYFYILFLILFLFFSFFHAMRAGPPSVSVSPSHRDSTTNLTPLSNSLFTFALSLFLFFSFSIKNVKIIFI